jgi:hypothetical protein
VDDIISFEIELAAVCYWSDKPDSE